MSKSRIFDENIKKLMLDLKEEIQKVDSLEDKEALEKSVNQLWAALSIDQSEDDLWRVNATTFLV